MNGINAHIELIAPLENEDNRRQKENGDRLSDAEIAAGVMKEVPEEIREDISNIVSGMNGYFTSGLLSLAEAGSDLVPEQDEDSDVQGVSPLYIKAEKFMDDDDVEEWSDALFKSWEWQRNQLYIDAYNDFYEGTVDLVIIANLGASRGDTIRREAKAENLPVMEVKVTDLVDKDEVFGDDEEEAEADEEAEAESETGEVEAEEEEGEALPAPADA